MDWRESYLAYGAPDRFLNLEYEDMVDVPEVLKAQAQAFVSGFISYRRRPKYSPALKPGLFFIGMTGKGKSSLLAIILKDLIRQQKIIGTARWLSVPLMSMTIKSSYDTHEAELDIIRPFLDTDLLILDDLGAAHFKRSADGVAWLEDRLFVVIEDRYCKCRPVLATSNLSRDELKRSLGARIYSRMEEMTEIVDVNELVPGDFRKKQSAKRKAKPRASKQEPTV